MEGLSRVKHYMCCTMVEITKRIGHYSKVKSLYLGHGCKISKVNFRFISGSFWVFFDQCALNAAHVHTKKTWTKAFLAVGIHNNKEARSFMRNAMLLWLNEATMSSLISLDYASFFDNISLEINYNRVADKQKNWGQFVYFRLRGVISRRKGFSFQR